MFYVGLDAHVRSLVVCILDANGRVCKETRLGRVEELLALLGSLPGQVAVCYEASCGYGALHDQLRRLPNVGQLRVAHPGRLRLIFQSKRKRDRVDARKLATLLFLGQAPQVHVPAREVRAWRAAIEFRRRLVDEQTRSKNQLRALLRGHGIATPHRKALWTRAGLAWLSGLDLGTPLANLQRLVLLDQLQKCRARIRQVTRELDAFGRRHAGVCLLRTIPGVGPRTAEAFMAYVDQPQRFGRSKQVVSYFGLDPCQDQSAERNRLGHITREGPGTVRKLLCEAAWQGVQRSPQIRARFERIQAGDPQRRKIALVATAAWLARVMFHMLSSGEVSRFTRFAQDDPRRKLPRLSRRGSPLTPAA